MSQDRFEEAVRRVEAALRSADIGIFTPTDLKNQISLISPETRVTEIIKGLIVSKIIHRVDMNFPGRNRTFYTRGKVPLEVVATHVHPSAYICHATAAHIHKLTDRKPEILYINVEQRLTSIPGAAFEQGRIDAAFRKNPRTSANIAKVGRVDICLLNGKNTGCLGVEEITYPYQNREFILRLTSLERTLIDLATRPFYAGGVHAVMLAFRKAAEKAAVDKLLDILKEIRHGYPYHQAIGFYMDRSGKYSQRQLDKFREIPMQFDFYLANRMGETRFVPEWRMHVPSDL